jgi:hypothetical protein
MRFEGGALVNACWSVDARRAAAAVVGLLLSAILGQGCATAVLTRPLEKGGHEVHASVGGPMIVQSGVPTPMPILQVGYRYGLTERVAIGGDVGVTVSILRNVALDPHVTWFPTKRLGVQAETVLVTDIGTGAFRAYPILSTWYVVPVTARVSLLPGLSVMGQAKQPRLLPAPSLGAAFDIGKWDLVFQAMYMAPNVRDRYPAVDYVSPGRGALGLYLGLGRRFQ